MATKAGSYTSGGYGPAVLGRHALYLVRQKRASTELVERTLERFREVEQSVAPLGLVLTGKRVLDVGCGQLPGQLACFSRRNQAIGIDRDVVAQGWEPSAYARMLRVNGVRRTSKTIVRKALRIDAGFRAELRSRIGPFGRLDVRQMDAAEMSFENESFDFVLCDSVLQHVGEPLRVLSEISRTLAPGGAVYAEWHLYTSVTGSLDPRALGKDFPLWAHLRPGVVAGLGSTADLNRLRLPDWRAVVAEALPGADVRLRQPNRAVLEPAARRLQQSGELLDYELDELVTQSIGMVWQKPAAASSS
jgi:SAM-dependent methyltransferase